MVGWQINFYSLTYAQVIHICLVCKRSVAVWKVIKLYEAY